MQRQASVIMGVESGGDDGPTMDDDEEEFVPVMVEVAEIGVLTNFVDGVGGLGIVAPGEVGLPPVPPLQSATQQFAEGLYVNAPHSMEPNQQLHYTPEILWRPQQHVAQPALQQTVQQPVPVW
jgi:hypothetical protein